MRVQVKTLTDNFFFNEGMKKLIKNEINNFQHRKINYIIFSRDYIKIAKKIHNRLKKNNNVMFIFVSHDTGRDYFYLKEIEFPVRLVRYSESIKDAKIIIGKKSTSIKKVIRRTTYNTLSYREREIVVCLMRGMSPAKICVSLNINIKTISRHKRNAMKKNNIRTTKELLDWYKENEILMRI